MRRLLLAFALLAATCAPAWAAPEWHDVLLLVPPEDRAALRAQADEYGAGNDFLNCGEWEGSTLANAVLDPEHLAAAQAWAASKAPATVLWIDWAALPAAMQDALEDPAHPLKPACWAGRKCYVRRDAR